MTEQKSPMYLNNEGQWQIREQELIEKIEEWLRLHTREGDCPCPEHQEWVKTGALELFALIKEAYKVEPPVLSEEEIAQAKSEADKLYWTHKAHPRFEKEKYLLETQRDADVRFYGSL